jgi:organic radical activating enzyme
MPHRSHWKLDSRQVTIIINDRCPLRCKHCSLAYSDSYHGTSYRINAADLISTIEVIDPNLYDMVLLAGGEPSLDPALIKTAVDACQRAGLGSSVVSAPVWAATEVSAKRFLDKIDGIVRLILSYDNYHLEFLKLEHYRIAAQEAAARGIEVTLEIVYSQQAEKQALIESIASFKDSVALIHTMRAVRLGNAALQTNVEMEYVTVNTIEDLGAIPRGCVLGNVLVDRSFGVHGCCWSSTGEASPFSFAGAGKPDQRPFLEMEGNRLFQAVREKGFLGSLSLRGKQLLADRVRGQGFVSECDICLHTMKKGNDDIWQECGGKEAPCDDVGAAVGGSV